MGRVVFKRFRTVFVQIHIKTPEQEFSYTPAAIILLQAEGSISRLFSRFEQTVDT
jgi:hypothetical protein